MNKRVLLVEDGDIADIILQGLELSGYSVELVKALPESPDHPRFIALMRRAQGFDLVIWDENIISPEVAVKTSEGFIQAFRSVFSGPMIANSAEPENRQKQLAAGCDIESQNKSFSALLQAVEDALMAMSLPV